MHKNSKIIISIIKICIFVILLAGAIYVSSIVLREKTTINKNGDFFSQNEDFDVLFFGSSHMEIFVNPMDLWKEFGIVSYNMGNPEESIETSYWLMKNAIGVHKPKLVVVDVAMFNLVSNNTNKNHLHYALDPFPITRNKIEAVKATLPDIDERLEMFFTLGSYHVRWKDLGEEDFANKDRYVKGNMSYGYWHTTKVAPTSQYPLVSGVKEKNDARDEVAIYSIIDLCRQEGVALLFVANPFCCQEYKQFNIHSVQSIAERESIKFINFIDEDFVTDFRVDYYDDDHVNQSGMHKVTYALGDYIISNYDIEDHREDETYSAWWDEYKQYKQLKLESLGKMADDINVFIELLHDSDYNVTIYLGKNFEYSHGNEELNSLIQNIGRENLTMRNVGKRKSNDLRPLIHLDECVETMDYLFCVKEGKVVNELMGNDAMDGISDVFDEISFSDDEMVICVSNRDNDELVIIRKYSSDGQSYEDVLYNIQDCYVK